MPWIRRKEPRRRVALKVFRGSAHTDSMHVRLFRREAETLGRLRHPSIGAICGAGRLPDGRPPGRSVFVEIRLPSLE